MEMQISQSSNNHDGASAGGKALSQVSDLELSSYRVPVEHLRWRCDTSLFNFECTDSLVPLEGFVGQERAIRSLEFALSVDKPGYNLFVTGTTGTGRVSAIQAYVRRAVESRMHTGVPLNAYDWCYVYNFAEPDRPKSLKLAPGTGRNLRSAVSTLFTTLQQQLTKAFESNEFKAAHESIEEEGRKQSQQILHMVQKKGQEEGFLVQPSPTGILVLPLVAGKPMASDQFLALNTDARKVIEEKQAAITLKVHEAGENARVVEYETSKRLEELHSKTAENAIQIPFKEIRETYAHVPEITQFLDALMAYTIDHVSSFFKSEQTAHGWPSTDLQPDPSLPFQINLLVDNGITNGMPILIEHHPTWHALFGKIERKAFAGTYRSDHTLLKPGALHAANGGYLILNVVDILSNPGCYEGLKRAMKTKQLKMEDLYEGVGLVPPQGLQPEPIPLEIKVILVGDMLTYQVLSHSDEEFWELFRIKADFDLEIERNKENLEAYAQFVCGCCNSENLRHFSSDAVARVAEYGARLVSDQQKLSARFGQLKELIIEADYWARQGEHTMVAGEDVEKAISEKIFRSSLVPDKLREHIVGGTLMIDVSGSTIGQVNGLEVFDIGDARFGKPVRITAKTFAGRQGVLNIERESRLSGRIHDKGVLIIGGYLGSKYAQSRPLGLAATLCFEQSYGEIDGDSASSAEVYAIVSSLSDIPLRQDLAVTGSINQHGEIQPIGGVNEKIEGFFDLCFSKGLTGKQGVIIPEQNVRNLMLKEEVVQSVQRGQFHIYAIKSIDQGLEILTGTRAGVKQADGSYPVGAIHELVGRRLNDFAKSMLHAQPENNGRAPLAN